VGMYLPDGATAWPGGRRVAQETVANVRPRQPARMVPQLPTAAVIRQGAMHHRYSPLLAIALLAASLAAAAPAHAAAKLVAFWSMETTTVMVDRARSNDGTPRNVTLVPGAIGKGYRFNGLNSIVLVPSSASLNPGRRDFRFTVFLRLNTVPRVGDYNPIRKGTAPDPGGQYKLELFSDQTRTRAQAQCTFRGTSGHAELKRGPNVADGYWHRITCAKTGTSIRLIVDSVPYTKRARIGSVSNAEPLVLGAKYVDGVATNRYKGDMDELRIQVG
jgi:Concanavalin A-like lectin/glucanases superfamily